MKTYESERAELIEWMQKQVDMCNKIRNKPIQLDGAEFVFFQLAVQQYNLKLKALKEKYNK